MDKQTCNKCGENLVTCSNCGLQVCPTCNPKVVEHNFYLRKKEVPGWFQSKCKVCKKETEKVYAKRYQEKKQIEALLNLQKEFIKNARQDSLDVLGLSGSPSMSEIALAFLAKRSDRGYTKKVVRAYNTLMKSNKGN